MRNRHWQIGPQVLTLVLCLGALAGVGNSLPAVWAQDELFVSNFANNSITVYARTASGNAAPLRTLAGAATGLSSPYGVAVDVVNNELVVTNFGNRSITVYARTASGNTAPLRTLAGPATGVTSPIGIAVTTASDPLLEQQWHLGALELDQTGRIKLAGTNARRAWSITKGAGIVIGIVDDGLQHDHPDLKANYNQAFSRDFRDPDKPFRVGSTCLKLNLFHWVYDDCHGTAVAGIAAARGGNGEGVSGVAPEASLADLRIQTTQIDAPLDAQIAAALRYRWDDIVIKNMSNSAGKNSLIPMGEAGRLALEEAVKFGRKGRGTIFVKSAGNGATMDANGAITGDNCNFDAYANSRFVITVGAVKISGPRLDYSEPCSALFVTAPVSGGITTTDLTGSNGYNTGENTEDLMDTNYTSMFDGTSAAAPIVSGVVALMLSKNPTLGWRDVKHILAKSSFKPFQVDPDGWTAGQFAHHEEYGFGLVDALAAVTLASNWTLVSPEWAIPSKTRTVNLDIPYDGAPQEDTINIPSVYSDFKVEHVGVEFTSTHRNHRDLQITLISPSDVKSVLTGGDWLDSGDSFNKWQFGSVRHWGETAVGAWRLQVVNRSPRGTTGTWNSWTLRIYGTGGPYPLTVTTIHNALNNAA